LTFVTAAAIVIDSGQTAGRFRSHWQNFYCVNVRTCSSISAIGVRNGELYLRDPSLLEIRLKWFRNWRSGGIINVSEYEKLQWLVATLPLTL
jgi:predicted  nucleic acid-binding Zn ribbon protein